MARIDEVVGAPAGMPPMVSNPAEDASNKILSATLAVTVLAFIVWSMRMYVRLVMVRNVGMDDYFMSAAMGLVIAGEGVIISSLTHGAGKHLGDIPQASLPKGMKMNFISQPIFLIAICVVKLAVGSTLLRIANTKFYRRLIIGIMVFMSVYTIGCFFTIVLQCTNIRANWDFSVERKCWPQSTLQALSYTNVALNIITDLALAVFIPGPMLWKLNVNRRTRATLLFALGLGVFACAAAFVKIGSIVNYGKAGDWLWDSQDISIWTVVECNVGLIAGSLPALRPIFKTILGTSLGYGNNKNTNTHGYYRHNSGTGQMHSARKSKVMGGTTSDETSSEHAFNPAPEYEMASKSKIKPATSVNVFADADALSSEESVVRAKSSAKPATGITKSTTTTVTYDLERQP
ncbi:hypothetical protein QBC39DRAFT_33849 [Podospora conica]|nr:hypothetical protein QBC39DRAFT_33849 [Schizothecium conicum]